MSVLSLASFESVLMLKYQSIVSIAAIICSLKRLFALKAIHSIDKAVFSCQVFASVLAL